MFDHVIETLRALPECQRNCEPIQELLQLLAIETKDQTNGTNNGPIDVHKKTINGLTDQTNGQIDKTIPNKENE